MPTRQPSGAPWTLCVLLALACLLLIWDLSGLDRRVMQALGTPYGFGGRDMPLLLALHEGGRWLSGGALLLTLWACLAPVLLGRGHGASSLGGPERLGWLASTVIGLLAVPALKQLSLTSCPWSLAEFGGTASWVSHWSWGAADGGLGHCFPSGHAAGAFAFMAAAWAWMPSRPRRGLALMLMVLLLGAFFGMTQIVRGAHYPSHVLWSAWLCASLGWGVQGLVRLSVARGSRAAAPHPYPLPDPA